MIRKALCFVGFGRFIPATDPSEGPLSQESSSDYDASTIPTTPSVKRESGRTVPNFESVAHCYITVNEVQVELLSGISTPILTGKDAKRTVKIIIPDGLQPKPHQGDRLYARFCSAGRTNDLLVPSSIEYTRTRDGVLLSVKERFQCNNGREFVLFDKSACCDLSAMPKNCSIIPGAIFKAGLVESRQPKYQVWRAHSLEFVSVGDLRTVPDDSMTLLVDDQIDFGSIPLGGTTCRSIVIQNTDADNRPMLRRIAVTDLPLQLIGPVHISDIHFPDDEPSNFHPSVDYYPFKEVKTRISQFEERQLTVRVDGTKAGRLDFVIHLYFHGKVTRTCRASAVILLPDGAECPVAMLPELKQPRRFRDISRKTCRVEATERLKELVDSERARGVVRPPNAIFPDDRQTSGWTGKFRSQFLIPDLLMDLMNVNDVSVDVLVQKFPVLGQPLTMKNYADKFHLLLFLEEHFELIAVRSFDLISSLVCNIEYGVYRLRMENLQEQRPSLIRGDTVAVRLVTDSDGPRFQGRISKIGLDSIDLVFDSKFKAYFKLDELFDFAFVPNRNYYRRVHNVLNIARRHLSNRLFFPDISNRERCIDRLIQNLEDNDEVEFFNKNLNNHQREAVKMVVVGRCQPLAHVIFGPPGTGKTVTLIEAIIQIYKRNQKSRLLVCAPSNAAADLIGRKIVESTVVPPEAIRRVLCVQRSHDSVPVELADSVQTGCVVDLPKHQRIILTTCLSASYFVELIHDFTHAFVDEAGFATEPEILIPLAAVIGRPDVQVVLAGDPNQLGPVVYSAHAKELGLEKSLLSRLLNLPAYGEWTDPAGKLVPYCPFLVSKLDISYRAVESLLKIPSKFFYNCHLKSIVSDEENVYAPRLGLPSMTFWPVMSLEHRESRSPSVANPGQAEVICQLMKNLLTVEIAAENIGIITPYRLQADYIRHALQSAGLEVPKIGTVEEFQGQEKDAIILSTVRARRHIADDSSVKEVLGFVSCPKRTNVALTRARFILMIVGDPCALSLDKHWKGIMRYCYAKDLYQKDIYNNRDYIPSFLADLKCIKNSHGVDPVLPHQQVPEVSTDGMEIDSQ